MIAALDLVALRKEIDSLNGRGDVGEIIDFCDLRALLDRVEAARAEALEEAARICDQKFKARATSGHTREASAARSLADEIRAIATQGAKIE